MWGRGRTRAAKPDRGDHLRLEIAVFAIVALLVVDALDSFRLPSLADERGQALTGRFLGEFYDYGARSGQDDIAVVLINDGTLDAWETGPPPPYLRQADLLLRIAAAEPSAIFMDFLYPFPRETPEARAYLGFAIDAAKEAGVPVFLGPVAERAEFAAFRAARQVDLAIRAERQDEYPMRGLGGRYTPAPALYAAHCDYAANKSSRVCDGRLLERLKQDDPAPIAVQWRPRAPSELTRYWRPEETRDCLFVADGLGERLRGAAEMVAREATRGLRADEIGPPRACFPHLAVPARLLLDDSMTDEDLARFAKGRVVLIGSAYLGSADETLAPGFGRIPGVFQHAMALDNLLTHGAAYRRWPPDAVLELAWDDLIEALMSIMLLALGSWAMHLVVRGAPRQGEVLASPQWRARVAAPAAALYAFLAMAALAPLLAGVLGGLIFNWAPANAIGVMLAVVGVGALVLQRNVMSQLRTVGVLGALAIGAAAFLAVAFGGGLVLAAVAPSGNAITSFAYAAISATLGVLVGWIAVALLRPRRPPARQAPASANGSSSGE